MYDEILEFSKKIEHRINCLDNNIDTDSVIDEMVLIINSTCSDLFKEPSSYISRFYDRVIFNIGDSTVHCGLSIRGKCLVISDIHLPSSYQRRGFASTLLEKLECMCVKYSLSSVLVEHVINTSMLPYLCSLGYCKAIVSYSSMFSRTGFVPDNCFDMAKLIDARMVGDDVDDKMDSIQDSSEFTNLEKNLDNSMHEFPS